MADEPSEALDPEALPLCPGCDEPSPLLGDGLALCDACGRLFAPDRSGLDLATAPPGIERVEALAEPEARGVPYRVESGAPPLELVLMHRHRPFLRRALGIATILVWIGAFVDRGIGVLVVALGLAAGVVAWGLLPREARVRFIADERGLAVGTEGVPTHRHLRLAADDIEDLYARAQARADASEDLRFDLLVTDRSGVAQPVLRGLEGPGRVQWLVERLQDALGFE